MRAAVWILCIALAAPAAAEGFFDLYAGGAFTRDDRETLHLPGARPRVRLEFEDSAVFGARIGGWGEGRLPFLGGALDVSGFRANGEDALAKSEIDVVPVSLLVLGRIPLLTSDEFPTGQIQPYVGAGPSLMLSRLEIPAPGSNFESYEADLGLDVRAGLAVVLTRPFGLFAEYRFSHFEPDYGDRVFGARVKIAPELSSHFVQAGVTFRF